MCGIAGFISTPRASESSALDPVRRMVTRMRARGPDAEGLWTSAEVVLGHRRLAILDLDARSNQPMVSADGRYAIVFNGEIYNFHELRRELKADGVAFRKIVNRPKTGFSLPMAPWLSKATDQRSWSELPLLAPAGTPWARRWGRIIVESTLACE